MRAVVAWGVLVVLGTYAAAPALLILAAYGVWKRRFSRPMRVAFGLSCLALWPGLWNFGLLTIEFPADLETTEPSAIVRLPSDARLRVGWGGDRIESNYHATVPDQRWAYDLLIEPMGLGSTDLEDYGCFGTPVVAPVSASVHQATDGAADQIPGDVSREFEHPAGNMVVLELERRTYLLIGHLREGSVRVRPGDFVEEGELIGECGNSGNTSEPHIHIHHQRQDPRRSIVNFAEGLPLYFRDHDGDPMPEGGVAKRDGKWIPTGAIVQHVGASSSM